MTTSASAGPLRESKATGQCKYSRGAANESDLNCENEPAVRHGAASTAAMQDLVAAAHRIANSQVPPGEDPDNFAGDALLALSAALSETRSAGSTAKTKKGKPRQAPNALAETRSAGSTAVTKPYRWLKTVIRRKHVSLIRRNKVRRQVVLDADEFDHLAEEMHENCADEQIDQQDLFPVWRERVLAVMPELWPVIEELCWSSKSVSQIAKELGLKPSRLWSQIYRMRGELRKRFGSCMQ